VKSKSTEKRLYPEKILLTGMSSTNSKAAFTVEELSAEAILFPLQETQIISDAVKELFPRRNWTVFTSPNAVKLYFEALLSSGKNPAESLERIIAVGPETAKELELNNFHADALPTSTYDSAGLIKLLQEMECIQTKSFALPCSQAAADTLFQAMKQLTSSVKRIDFYKPHPSPKKALPAFDAGLFFSPSGVKTMMEYYGPLCLKDKEIGSIGKTTAASIQALFSRESVYPEQSSAVNAVKTLLQKLRCQD